MASKPKTRTNSYGWVIYKMLKSYQDYYCLQKGAIHSALPSPWVGNKSLLPPTILQTYLKPLEACCQAYNSTMSSRPEAFYFAMLICFLIMFKVSITCKKGIRAVNKEQKDHNSKGHETMQIGWVQLLMIMTYSSNWHNMEPLVRLRQDMRIPNISCHGTN